MKTILSLLVFFTYLISYAQMGVGTTSPDASAQLDISANDKGVLVPRIGLSNVTQTTLDGSNTAATGLLIWNTNVTTTGGNGVGFYFFNGAQWIPITQENHDADWYEENTTTPANAITDDIYTNGNVGIGVSYVQYPLQISSSSETRTLSIENTSNGSSIYSIFNNITGSSPSNGITKGITNNISRTGQSYISGVANDFYSSESTVGYGYLFGYENFFGNSSSVQSVGLINRFQGTTTSGYGVKNIMSGTATNYYGLSNYNLNYENITATIYGLHNDMSGIGNGIRYGVYTNFTETGGGAKYGEYIHIASGAGGTHYGIYADVTKATGYAGYFLGRVAIGNLSTNTYILPSSRGTNGQVMQTDGSGVVSWVNASSLGSQKLDDLSDAKSDSDGTNDGSSVFIGVGSGTNDDSSDNGNVGVGYQSLLSNTSGISNTAIGYQSLYFNTTGFTNTANGFNSLYKNTTGNSNTANGFKSLYNNLIGASNVANGYYSLYSNTTGNFNTANGSYSLNSNTTGDGNSANGSFSLNYNTTGEYNTANGYHSLFSNTIGNYNTANGTYSLSDNTTGSYNTATGYQSLYENSIGLGNTTNGYHSLFKNLAGNFNTATGYSSLYSNTGGNYNTANGCNSLFYNTLGDNNTVLGNYSGYHNYDGDANVFLGFMSGYYELGSNKLYIENSVATPDNALIYGEFGIDDTTSGNILRTNGSFQIGNPAYTGYAFPTADGSLNQVLRTDGSGNVSWVNQTVDTDTDNQTIDELSLTGDTLNISLQDDGVATQTLNLSAIDNQTIDLFSLSGTVLNLSLQNDGMATQTVNLASLANDWKITGNTGTLSGTNFIGTTDAQDLDFRTNNVVKLKLTQQGQLSFQNTGGSVFVGAGAGSADDLSANQNTFVGTNAGNLVTTGNLNTAIGHFALDANVDGFGNTAIGKGTLNANVSGYNNTALGRLADVSFDPLNNATVIGFNASVNASNKIRLGNSSVTVIEGQVAYSFPSDARFKFNVQENVPGLDFISRLKPVTYQFDTQKFDAYINPKSVDNDVQMDYQKSMSLTHSGFLAQDVEQICKDLGYEFDGLHIPDASNPYDNYSVSYSQFIMPLVKAVQEQQEQIEKATSSIQNYEDRMKHLETENLQLKSELDQLKALEQRIKMLESK